MKKLFSPWRSEYIQSFKVPAGKKRCVLCTAWKSPKDEQHLVVARGKHSLVMLNLYPYNSGHCMIIPARHIGRLGGLSDAEYGEMYRFVRKVVAALEKISSPDGYNVGMNLGRTAGAGIDDHVHFHVVPRWNGDTNFMPVLADVKVISDDMKTTWEKLKNALKGKRR